MIDNESKCFTKGQGIYPRSRASSLSEANRAIAALQAKIEKLTAALNSIISETDEWICCHDVNQIAKAALKESE